MNSSRTSLSALVEKWLGLNAATPRFITRIRHPGQHKGCVQVRVLRSSGDLSLFFFRHADGSWRVFPPHEATPR
jgi:hypothetical protein